MPTDDCREFVLKNLEDVLQKYAAQCIKKNEENIRCTIKILISNLGFKDSAELTFKFTDNGVEYTREMDCIIIKSWFFNDYSNKV